MRGVRVRDGLHIEAVDEAVLVLDPRSSQVYELTGLQVEAFRLAEAAAGEVPGELTAAMAGLVELGLVQGDGWDRRRVLLAGGAMAAAGIAAVALPSPAAAQSAPGGGGPTPTTPAPATAPEQPVITGFERSAQIGNTLIYRIYYQFNGDGGSTITGLKVYVNGTLRYIDEAPNGADATVNAYEGDLVELAAVNAVGESPAALVVINR